MLTFPRYASSFTNAFARLLGHVRTLPRLVKVPFRYTTYAYGYLDVAKCLTSKPVKQAVITASALSLVYAPHLLKSSAMENYSHGQFLHYLIGECEKDIRLCLGHLNESVKNVSIDSLEKNSERSASTSVPEEISIRM